AICKQIAICYLPITSYLLPITHKADRPLALGGTRTAGHAHVSRAPGASQTPTTGRQLWGPAGLQPKLLYYPPTQRQHHYNRQSKQRVPEPAGRPPAQDLGIRSWVMREAGLIFQLLAPPPHVAIHNLVAVGEHVRFSFISLLTPTDNRQYIEHASHNRPP